MDKTYAVVEAIVEEMRQTPDLDNHKLNTIKKQVAKAHGYKSMLTNIQILTHLRHEEMDQYKDLLLTKPIRTQSGVAVVAIMTKPLGCPHGKCTYCPGGLNSQFGDVPQSYTGNEPATMRAIRNKYDPYLQIINRLEQYIIIGQNPEKVELIIMGGTFPSYPKKYKEQFIAECYQAMNDFSSLLYNEGVLDISKFMEFFELPGPVEDDVRTAQIQKKLVELKEKREVQLEEEQKTNENAQIRCIGLTIETKPDWGKLDIGNEILRFGATRVELGIQTIYDPVLQKIHRGHTIDDSKESIRILKDLGFKLNFHMMPGLPGVSKEEDIKSLQTLFTDPSYKPDMLKIYPTMVFPGTPLYEEMKAGTFTPLTTEESAEIVAEAKKDVPKYCRIMRVQRDIPTKLGSGVDKNNLRQYIDVLMEKKGYQCKCIRCREIKGRLIEGTPFIDVQEYEASQGKEFFISMVDEKDRLLGFVRLRFPSQSLREEIPLESALIRELHVYGSAIGVGEEGKVQHTGFGKKLMQKAEDIAKEHKKNKIVVISGVGVRKYYEKLGYSHDGPYMSKKLA